MILNYIAVLVFVGLLAIALSSGSTNTRAMRKGKPLTPRPKESPKAGRRPGINMFLNNKKFYSEIHENKIVFIRSK